MPYVISKQHPPLATIHQHLWQAKCRLPLCIVIRYDTVLCCFVSTSCIANSLEYLRVKILYVSIL
jgi:hypothetical protein